jgi:hypothetical protein
MPTNQTPTQEVKTMPNCLLVPPTGASPGPVEVRVGEIVYTLEQQSPTNVPIEHLAAVTAAVQAALGGTAQVITPAGIQ